MAGERAAGRRAQYYAASLHGRRIAVQRRHGGRQRSGDVISGTLRGLHREPGFTYQILVTNETDVEYAWALEPVSAPPAPSRSAGLSPSAARSSCAWSSSRTAARVRVVGQVWAEENAADAGAYPDLRIEYRAITGVVPPFPNSVQPAQKRPVPGSVTLAGGGAVGRVSLVNVNTKRIYGEFTMPTGLMRSFIVPPNAAGQDTRRSTMTASSTPASCTIRRSR